MDECTKRIPTKVSRQIFHSDPSADVPDVSWIRESEVAIRVSHRFIQEPLVFWITTDDPIQRDDVRGKKLTGNADEIPVDESYNNSSSSPTAHC
jgi:hypothetical protein